VPVIETELLARNETDQFLGVITLNRKKSLNALDLKMVQLMITCLEEWKEDKKVVAVFIQGAGEKAFCAGGDVVSMYTAMNDLRTKETYASNRKLEHPPEFLNEFFSQEYRLDYLIHCFPKPIITWGSGIVMGGGLGLFAASKFAIVTETSRIAMPEITIGLFPDVGGSYFLNQMPKGIGLFLGLTGASFFASDAAAIKLATHKLATIKKQSLISQILTLPTVSEQSVEQLLNLLQAEDESEFAKLNGELCKFADKISILDTAKNLADIFSMLETMLTENPDSSWLNKALINLKQGSPITAHLVFEQLQRSKGLSLADCFRQELSMALSCGMYGEFEEGVRALLIDKDRTPNWSFKNINDVPLEVIESHFSYFDDVQNPLFQLEQDYGVLHG
jgi:enoyl-CoA hydratase/carnithine racemase